MDTPMSELQGVIAMSPPTSQARPTEGVAPTPRTPQLRLKANAYAPATPTTTSPLENAARRRRDPSTPTPNSHGCELAVFAGLTNPSPQQEPGSVAYLARLLRLSQSRPGRPQRPKVTMADFLASFDLGAQKPAQSNNLSCGSVQDVQLHLRGVLDAKATPNRAEHVSITMELRSTVRFTLVLSESENGVLEGLNHIDPSLGGSRSTPVPIDQTGGQLSRVVEANETLMNQPQDDPTLQRSIAKHIIAALSATDGSNWTAREVSRGAQGWSFTYVCKDSYEQWSRQNAKKPGKAIIGEYSQREPDPTLSNRPAFDCRGSVVIAFNRNNRAITVKYDHTPLHKTVAQLADYFKPPPRQLGLGAQRAEQQKAPKMPKTPKEKKKRQESTKAQDEKGNPRKRKRKDNGAATQPSPPNGPVMPPDYPGVTPVTGRAEAGPSYTNGLDSAADSAQNTQAFNKYPQGLVGEAQTENGSQKQQLGPQPPGVLFPVNVSAAEAVRRKNVAVTMLSNVGVDPDTLSAEQFNIFANQSPELQKDSLSMLVKYGAERLRIVHPSNREGSASGTPSTSTVSTQGSQPTSTGPMTTKELAPHTGARSTQNEPSTADTAAAAENSTQTPGRTKRGMGKSRTACFSCKIRKVKCPRQRPCCAECERDGIACEYAPQKPRNRKSAKSDAIVVGDDEDEEEPPLNDTEVDQSQLQGSEHHEVPDYSSHNNMPVANMLTPRMEQPTQEHPQPDYFQSVSGLALSQVQTSRSVLHQPHDGSGFDPSRDESSNPGMGIPQPIHPMKQPQVPTQPDSVSPRPQRKRAPRASTAKSRRSLPSVPNHADDHAISTNPQSASPWPAMSGPAMPPATTVSPQVPDSTTTKQRNQQPSNPKLVDSTQLHNGLKQAAALSQAALYQLPDQADPTQNRGNMRQGMSLLQAATQPHQSPPIVAAAQAVHRTSPFQQVEVPRAKSGQNQRTQSRNTVTNQSMSGGYQPPHNPPPSNNSAAPRSSATGGLPGHNDYGRYSTSTSTKNQSSQKPTYDTCSHQQPASKPSSAQQAGSSTRNATIAMSMSSQPPSNMVTSYPANVSSSDQWSGSQGHNTRSYKDNNSSYHTQRNYPQQPSTSSTPSASLQNFSIHANTPQRQQQQQDYSSQSTRQQQGQPVNRSQSWNYYNNPNNTSHATPNQSSEYSWKMPDESWSGV